MLLREEIGRARQAGRDTAADQAQAMLDGIWQDVFPTMSHYQPPYERIVECRRKIAEAILTLKAEAAAAE